jgi:hypothetical protein
MSIERAQGFEFPQIYSKFQSKSTNYVIQDIPSSRFEEVIEFLVPRVLGGEPICEFSKIIEDPKAVESSRAIWRKILPQNASLVCLQAGTGEIVGVNILKVVSEGDDNQAFNQVFF